MSIKRLGILLGKEIVQGPKSFIFIWVVVAPVLISLVLSLVFGSLFSDKPRLGVVDDGSQMLTQARELTSIVTREYGAAPEMREAVRNGSVDMGIVLPDDFDILIKEGKKTAITAYIWGGSLAKNRTILEVTIWNLARQLAGQEPPIEIQSTSLGGEAGPWSERLLPLVVLMAVFLGGLFLPATSIIGEKEKRTLQAVLITPATVEEVFLAKGLFGFMLSTFAGIIILALNQAFGTEPALLMLVLALGAVMAAALGLLFGTLLKDITSLFAIWKLGGILLFAPALVYMFPQIPKWVARIFPTYYLIQPIFEISQRGATWAEIATNVFILMALDVFLLVVVAVRLNRAKQYAF